MSIWQEEYDRTLPLLNRLVELRELHAQESCGAGPMCMGRQANQVLLGALAADRSIRSSLLLVAMGELGQVRRALAETSDRLKIQRELTKDVLRALELAGERADEAEARVYEVTARNDDLERRLAAVEAELTMWQDAADCIGPVGLPIEE